MTARFAQGMLIGFIMGDLPDDGLGWHAAKLAFAILIMWMLTRAYRREFA